MADNEIVYTIKVDDKAAKGAIDSIDKQAASAGGSNGGFGKIGAAISSIGPMAVAAGAAIATYFVSQGLRAGIDAAIEQEDAINKMNNALSMAGRLSQESSQDFISFANELQATRNVADDVAAGYLALATNYARTNEESKKLVSAAIDLSAAMGISVDQALRSLGGTLSGSIGLLGRSVGAVKDLTEAQLKSGQAIDIVAAKFGGAGAAATKTYAGSITSVKLAFGDFLEEIGNFFVKSDALRKAFGFVAQAVRDLTSRFAVMRENSGDIFKPLLLGSINVVQFLVNYFYPIMDVIINLFQKLARHIGGVAALLVQVFSGEFVAAANSAKTLMSEAFDFSTIFETKGTDAANGFLNGLRNAVASSSGTINAQVNESMNAAGGKPDVGPKEPEKVLESLDLITFAYANFFGKVTKDMESFKVNQAKLEEALKKGLFTTMVNGVGNSMKAVGSALAKGEDGLAAFGAAMLGMFAEMAMQAGQYFFLLGIASLWTNPAAAAGLIAGGLGLMVFGGVLSALAGGGGGGGGGSAPASSSASASSAMSAEIGDDRNALADQERQRVTDVSVIVQGNVIGDKRTFGKEIAEALNDAFGNDGIIVARGAIA